MEPKLLYERDREREEVLPWERQRAQLVPADLREASQWAVSCPGPWPPHTHAPEKRPLGCTAYCFTILSPETLLPQLSHVHHFCSRR